MADTPNGAGGADEQQRAAAIRAGMAVYDAQGARIGSVQNTEPGKGYFETKSGGVFSRDLYIPLDAVARVENTGIHLKVVKRDLDTLDWYLPPTNGVDVDTPYSSSPWIETGYGQGERPVPADERARMLERDERAGVQPPSPPDAAADAPMREREHTDTLPQSLAPDALGTSGDEPTMAVPVAEEHLEARTHREPDGAGTAHVRKVVGSEQRSLEVPVTHDELRAVRVPVTDESMSRALGPDIFMEKDIDVPLMGEQVELATRTRVTEEVVLRKRQVTQQRTYTGKVRKERVWVEGPGGDAAPGAGERDIGDEDTIAYDRFAEGQEGPEAYRQ